MTKHASDKVFNLSDVEVETLRRAAIERDMLFDRDRREYTSKELAEYGLVREAYNSSELKERGISNNVVVTSFDKITAEASNLLLVDTPFASKIKKWQLPIDICEWRVLHTEFPPNTFVEPHVHPENTAEDPGGSLRIVTKGSITYAGKRFEPGDWFFVPNGIPYSFRSDPDVETHVMYLYRFFAVAEGNRFSHPIDIRSYRRSDEAVA